MKSKQALVLIGVLAAACCAHAKKAKDPVADQMAQALAPRAFCRFVPERSDDFAFENNLIAMRVYGPALNKIENVSSGVDCWMKRVEYPIVNKWYQLSLGGHSHHVDRGEGWDGYKVGESAGAGGSGLWIDGERVPLGTFTTWKILENTPARCAFLLTYEKELGGSVYKEEKKITLEMNTRLYTAESAFFKDGAIAAGLPVCVGVTSHAGAGIVSANARSGWVSCWEVMDDGYGLGTAAAMPPDRIKSVEIENGDPAAKGVTGHVLLIGDTDANGKISYAGGYGWQRAGAIETQDDWHAYLAEFCAAEYE